MAPVPVLDAFIGIFVLFLFLARSQQTVDDASWMEAMIPHHSIAIQTSSYAEISDPRVRKLADEIIEAQLREIAEMKMLLEDIENNGELGDGTPIAPVPAVLTPELLEKAEKRIREEGRDVTPEIRETVEVGS